jgi:hypothetical protein
LLGRDLEQMKSDYTCVYDHVIKKDNFLKVNRFLIVETRERDLYFC